jgi:hypothetical protein
MGNIGEMEQTQNPEESLPTQEGGEVKANSIERLEGALESPEFMKNLHEQIISSEHVKALGLEPSQHQVTEYLGLTKGGMEYAAIKYGKDSVPENYTVCLDTWDKASGKRVDYVFYDKASDCVHVSAVHMASVADAIGNPDIFIYEGHLGKMVAPEDSAFFGAMEECHHKKFFNEHPGYTPEDQANREGADEIEQAWGVELEQLAEELNIKTYSEDQFNPDTQQVFDPNHVKREPQA